MSHSCLVSSTVVVFRRRRHMPHCHSVELRFINLSPTESENFSLSLIPVSTRVLSVSTLVSNATVHTISNTAVFRLKVVGRLSSRRRGMEPLFSSFSRIPSKYMQLCIDRPDELLAKPLLDSSVPVLQTHSFDELSY